MFIQDSEFVKEFDSLDLPIKGVRFPKIEISEKVRQKLNLPLDCTNYDILEKLSRKGLQKLNLDKKEYEERLKYELNIVNELEFTDYFLLVWDVINFAKENRIAVGTARGSAAASLILYSIGITGIDPIKHKLYFERFISETRAQKTVISGITYYDGKTLPDIDIDFDLKKRSEVVNYLKNKYPNRVCNLPTMLTLTSKILIKECGKIVMGKTEMEMNKVSSLIPSIHGKIKNLDKTYEEIESFQDWCNENKLAFNIALKLRNLIKARGKHASALLITHDLLKNVCPVELSKDKDLAAAYDMNWALQIGIKLDCLGLRTVSVIDDVCKQVKMDVKSINIDDPFIYEKLQDLKCPDGLFQIEATINYNVCQKVKPRDLEELSAVIALARPGSYAFVDEYAKNVRKEKIEKANTGSNKLDKILSETNNVILFQETIMRIAHEVFELSLRQADDIRIAAGKKIPEKMAEFKDIIFEQGKKLKIEKAAEFYWKVLEDSASYLFNKNHSVSYSAITAITTFLKFKYPLNFYLALLKASKYEQDPKQRLMDIQRELKHFDIELLPPNLLKSELDFTIENDNIRFGLTSLKGIGEKSIENLNKFKNKYSNKFEVFQAAKEAGLNIGILSALLQAGALEDLPSNRSRNVLEAQIWGLLTDREKKKCLELGEKFEYKLIKIVKYLATSDVKPFIKETRMRTLTRDYDAYKQIYLLNSRHEDFACWYYETDLLGYSYQYRLREIFDQSFKRMFPKLKSGLITLEEALQKRGESVSVVAIVKGIRHGKSRPPRENRYYHMDIVDESSSFGIKLWEERIDDCKIENDGLPQEGNIIVFNGFINNNGMINANRIKVQDQKIYMKLKDLKDKN